VPSFSSAEISCAQLVARTDPTGISGITPRRATGSHQVVMEANGLPLSDPRAAGLQPSSRSRRPEHVPQHCTAAGQLIRRQAATTWCSWRSTPIRQRRHAAPWRPRCVLPCRGGSSLGGTVLRQLTARLTAQLTAALATVRLDRDSSSRARLRVARPPAARAWRWAARSWASVGRDAGGAADPQPGRTRASTSRKAVSPSAVGSGVSTRPVWPTAVPVAAPSRGALPGGACATPSAAATRRAGWGSGGPVPRYATPMRPRCAGLSRRPPAFDQFSPVQTHHPPQRNSVAAGPRP
jgi:hypothetical protein